LLNIAISFSVKVTLFTELLSFGIQNGI
jgi:hypothetical protein